MIKAFIHIIVAFLVFFSSSGLWINNHYCQDKLVKTSFFFSFGSCCGAKALESCTPKNGSCSKKEHNNHEEEEEGKGCCDNKADYVKLENDQQILKAEFKPFKKMSAWSAITPSALIQLPILDKRTSRFYNHSPPLLVFDRQVRLQTFLC